jgi:tetratricopeptide (TPR) repeat protein
MTPPDTSPPPPAPPRRKWVGYLFLIVGAWLAVYVGYQLWLVWTAPTPPDVDLSAVEPLVAEAVREAQARVRAHPRHPAAWGHLGMTLHAHELHLPAKQCYATAERYDPANAAWAYLAADCEFYAGDPAVSLEHFRRAAERGGEPVVRVRYGEALFDNGRVDDAEAAFRHALTASPDDPRAHLGLARVLMERGRPRDALDHLTRCLARADASTKAWSLKAQAHHELGEGEAATAARSRVNPRGEAHAWPDPYLEQVSGRQTGVIATGRRAAALLRANRGAEAQAVLEDLVRREPTAAKAQMGLGRVMVLRNQPAAAEPVLREALRLDPNSFEARFHLANALAMQGKRDEAVVEYRKVLADQPDNGEAHLKLGQCQYALGDKPAAAAALRNAVRYEPNNVLAQKNLGVVLYELKRYADAVTHLDLAATLAPADEQTKTLLARARHLADAAK